MKAQKVVILVNSLCASSALENSVSEELMRVTGGEVMTVARVVAPQASIPFARLVAAGDRALQASFAGGAVATSFTTTEVGTPGVRRLEIRSRFTERETSPLGSTGQLQQASSSEDGLKT